MVCDTEAEDAKKVSEAYDHIQNGQLVEAEFILRDVCFRCPDEYDYEYMSDGKRYIKFWSLIEFMEYTTSDAAREQGESVWLLSAYPRACYYLAFVLIEKGKYEEAVRWLTKGQTMEPHNPKFFIELGVAHAHLGEPEIAFGCYHQALQLANKSIHDHDKAVALRGMGVQLIDLGRLNEAKLRLIESLDIEPESDLAKGELLYIAELEGKH